jgi:hypothetical protein
MKYPVNIQDKSTSQVYGVDGHWIHGMYRTTRPERVMVFPSEMVAAVFARANFRRPGQTDEDVKGMMEGLKYPDAVTPR